MKYVFFVFFVFLICSLKNYFSFNNINKNLYIRKIYMTDENKQISSFDYKIYQYLKRKSSEKCIIIDRKNDKVKTINSLKKDLKNKKIISISPGGIQSFYFMGIIQFLKENCNLDNIIYTGASAGAWISLFSSYKKDSNILKDDILGYNYKNLNSIIDLQLLIKKNFLKNYKDNDFDLENIFIGVTVLKDFKLSTNIFFNFIDLEDALNCCIASSHIPLLTGGFINKYNNEISFDGGFSNFPYLDLNNTILSINPNIWKDKLIEKNFIDYYEFTINHNFTYLYNQGFKDTKRNFKKIKDKFIKK